MRQPILSRRSVASPLLFIIGVSVLLIGLIGPPVASAEETRPGATDPAANYARWPDDELFLATPILTDDAAYFQILASTTDLATLNSVEETQSAAADYRDVVGAANGRFLTPNRDSVALAYRNGADLDVKFFKQSASSYSLKELAARVSGSADFFDLAAGDLDGLPSTDPDQPERRDEVVVAYAGKLITGSYPVKVAVLDFRGATEAEPAATQVTIASATANSNISAAKPYPPHNIVAVATGDFDGDHLKEIAVAYVNAPGALYIDVLRYTATRNPANGVVTTSLQVVGKGAVKLDANWSLADLSAVAGDFNGDGRDELAIGTSQYNGPANRRDVSVKVFRITGSNALTVTLARDIAMRTGPIDGATGRIQIAAGLFKFDPNPANGWVATRRQLAVAFRSWPGVVEVATIELEYDLTPVVNPAWNTPGRDPNGGFWLTAGGLRGSLKPSDPTHSLALLTWDQKQQSLSLLKTTAGAAPERQSLTQTATRDAATSGARRALAASDYDGDSIFLGAPVHFTVENLVRTDFILQEPPKHAYWDGEKIVNVSRSDEFYLALQSLTGQQLNSEARDNVSWTAGGSASASASLTAKAGGNVGIAKAEASVTTAVSGTIGYDYDNAEASYNQNFVKREVAFGGSTKRDDIIVGQTQVLDIWRYRVYGLSSETPGAYPYFEIVVPGPFGAISMQTQGGGLNYDWYQPRHENGNILSYPRRFLTDGKGNPDIVAPPDMGSFTTGGATITQLMYGPSEKMFGGDEGLVELTFQQGDETGATYSSSHKLNANVSIKSSASATAEAFGSGVTAAGELGFELHGSYSWGRNATASYQTSRTTGLSLRQPPGGSDKGYAYYPLIYTTSDGTIKATYAVDPTRSFFGKEFWFGLYNLPDLALNLPARFYVDEHGDWSVNTLASRKQMRGFFVSRSMINPITQQYEQLAGPVKDGATVRLEARVYNYSVGDYTTVPSGAKACFYKIRFDAAQRKELDTVNEASKIGCAALPAIPAQEMVVAAIPWDTTGASNGSSQTYRIYVRLDPENKVIEKYDSQPDWLEDPAYCLDGVCVDPGQNNEGYGWVTIAQVGLQAGALRPPHVGMAEDGVAAVNLQGEIVTGNVAARLNQLMQIRLTVISDIRSLDQRTVLLYDGDPDQGGELIASKTVFASRNGPDGFSVWIDWAPTSAGKHQLVAKVVQSVDDPAPGNNTGRLNVTVLTDSCYLPLLGR